jgi:hypothetical protein
MDTELIDLTLDRTAFSVVSLDDESNELAYWLTRTPEERIHHTEFLRQINYGHKVNERLQRVLEVVELESS